MLLWMRRVDVSEIRSVGMNVVFPSETLQEDTPVIRAAPASSDRQWARYKTHS